MSIEQKTHFMVGYFIESMKILVTPGKSHSLVFHRYMACHSSSKFFVEKLLSYKANPCFQRRSNLTKVVDLGAQRHFSDNCLTWSCHSADLDIVRMILDAGATFSLLPSDTVAWTDTTKVDRKRRPAGYRKYLEFSPLFYAAFMGDFDILKCLLDAATTTKAAQTLQKNVGRGGNENFSGACNVVDLSTVGPHGETLEMLLFRVHRVSIDDCMRLARTLAHGPRQVTVVTQFEIIGRSEREDAPLADAMCSQSSFVTEEGASATYGPAARARAEKLFQSAFHSAAKVRHADVSTVLDMSPTLRAQYVSRLCCQPQPCNRKSRCKVDVDQTRSLLPALGTALNVGTLLRSKGLCTIGLNKDADKGELFARKFFTPAATVFFLFCWRIGKLLKSSKRRCVKHCSKASAEISNVYLHRTTVLSSSRTCTEPATKVIAITL